jgi:hypothetical protein
MMEGRLAHPPALVSEDDGQAFLQEGPGIAELVGDQVDELVGVGGGRCVDLTESGEGQAAGVAARDGRDVLGAIVVVVLDRARHLLAE